MRNLMLLLLALVLMSVVGCAGTSEGSVAPIWRLYRLCIDRAGIENCLEVKSTSKPTVRQAGWADSKADPAVPSWIFLYEQGQGQTFFKTLGGFNPRVKDLGSTIFLYHPQQASCDPKRSQFF